MTREDLEESCVPSSRHVQFRDRVKKTFYYGQYSDRSLPSLAVTDVAVEVLNTVTPTKRKQLDANYALAVSRRAKISPCTLMMGILYSERLQQKNPDYLKRVSSSDLFLISMMVASKYLYDEGEDEEVFNDDWAKAGSKTVNVVNKLEMEFLASIDWSLFISNEDFLDFVNKVESRIATTHGLGRGWFTYGDLSTLLDNASFLKTLGILRMEVLKVLCACAVAYVLSVSLALSLTTLALSRHCSLHSRVTSLPTESTCSSLKTVATEVPSLLQGNLYGKTLCKLCRNSQFLTQEKKSLAESTLEQRVDQFEESTSRLTSENLKSVCEPDSYRSPVMPNKTILIMANVPSKQAKLIARGVSPNLSCCSHLLLPDLPLQNLLSQPEVPSTTFPSIPTRTVAKSDYVFSDIVRKKLKRPIPLVLQQKLC